MVGLQWWLDGVRPARPARPAELIGDLGSGDSPPRLTGLRARRHPQRCVLGVSPQRFDSS